MLGSGEMEDRGGQGLHVAIIMDGNGRWANWRGLHARGGATAQDSARRRRIVERADEIGIRCLTPLRILFGQLAPAGL